MQKTALITPLNLAILVTIGMAVTVGSALGFEHIGGYIPCALCLQQRIPYYIGIPVGILAIVAFGLHLPPWVGKLLLLIIVLLMVVGAGMGIYHAGVEWQFWEGPASCSVSSAGVSVGSGGGSVLDMLNKVHGPSCTEAALRFLDLSFAGWNVVASVILTVIALVGAKVKA